MKYCVEVRADPYNIGDEFDHLIAYALACTLESEDVNSMGFGRICFGLLNEVIIGDGMTCFDESYGVKERC